MAVCGGGGGGSTEFWSSGKSEYSEGWEGKGSGEDVRFRSETPEGLKRAPHICEVPLSGSHSGMQARLKIA